MDLPSLSPSRQCPPRACKRHRWYIEELLDTSGETADEGNAEDLSSDSGEDDSSSCDSFVVEDYQLLYSDEIFECSIDGESAESEIESGSEAEDSEELGSEGRAGNATDPKEVKKTEGLGSSLETLVEELGLEGRAENATDPKEVKKTEGLGSSLETLVEDFEQQSLGDSSTDEV